MYINGIYVEIERNSPNMETIPVSDIEKSYHGSRRGIVKTPKRFEGVTSSYLSKRKGEAIYTLLSRRGDFWSFDNDIWSSKGMKAVIDESNHTIKAGGKFNDYIEITDDLVLPLYDKFEHKWTVSFWRLESTVWHHYIIQSDDKNYKDTEEIAKPAWITVTTNSLTFNNTADSIDEVFVFPSLVDLAMVNSWYNFDKQFPDYPHLLVEDSLLSYDGEKLCLGEVRNMDIIDNSLGRIISFDLEVV